MITATQVEAEQELASLCGVLNASYARLVTLVAAALEDESWAIAGIRSPEHWLTMVAGLSPYRAKAIVSVARRHGELPTVMGEFADGQLSFDQVAVVARYAPAHVEASVAEFAVFASVPQLRRSLTHYSFDPPAQNGYVQGRTTRDPWTDTTAAGDSAVGDSVSSDSASSDSAAGDSRGWNGYALEQDRSGAPCELSMSHDQWGGFCLRFTAPADLGALVEAALKEAKDALFTAGRPKVTLGDALVECHHLIHWVDGGPTDTWNLASLCSFHHDGHHVGDFTVSGDANDPTGLTFNSRAGRHRRTADQPATPLTTAGSLSTNPERSQANSLEFEPMRRSRSGSVLLSRGPAKDRISRRLRRGRQLARSARGS